MNLDLAVANQNAGNVSILLGNGNGTFSPAAGSPVAAVDPVDVEVANLDGTGGLDLAVANENLTGVGSVSILLGNGTGGFTNAAGSPITTGPTGSGPQSVAVADLNGAGGLDLAVAHENDVGSPGFVAILLGNGNGTFGAAAGSPVTVGNLPQSVEAADLNGDGNRDLAVTNEASNNLSLLFGNGAGAFPTSSTVAVGLDPNNVEIADLNGNLTPDLIVANAGGNTVSILLGNGTGGFSNASGSPVAVGSAPEGTVAADFNGDSKLDLAVANAGATSVSILVGNGAGGFTAASPVPAGTEPTTVGAGDLNGDGKPDLAVANYGSDNTTVALNTTPAPPPTAVTINSFVGRATANGIALRWRTAQEIGFLGFEIYRDGVKVNRKLVAARGSGAGAQYRLLDRHARAGVRHAYRLQAVRVGGSRVWLGTVAARR